MRHLTSFRAILALLITVSPAYVLAGHHEVAEMANIVMSLQHFPSETDQQALTVIAAGEGSESIKAVAGAIAGIKHAVSEADKATLMKIAADESEPAGLRELATIVAGINHVPSADAKAALEALASR